MTTIAITLDMVEHLTADQALRAQALKGAIGEPMNLDDAEQALRLHGPGWHIHRGGHHISVHLTDGDWRRVLFVREEG